MRKHVFGCRLAGLAVAMGVLLLVSVPYAQAGMRGDINGDGVIDFADINPFIECIIHGVCPNEWVERRPETPEYSPSARCDHAMAYDSARKVTVLFGGWNQDGFLNDTWEWNGITWTQIATPTAPSPRNYPAMAYDPASCKVVLFGGGLGNDAWLNDTWEWDGVAWTNRTPADPNASPSPRTEAGMIYDEAHCVMLLFGGQHGYDFYGDTWQWDSCAGSWTQLFPAVSPEGRCGPAMAYDEARGEVVMFGGVHYFWDERRETWCWNGSTWIDRTPNGETSSPPGAVGPKMVYDADRQLIVLFGGYKTATFYDETWEWNGSVWARRLLDSHPAARMSHAMAYDSARQVAVMFGGAYTLPGDSYGDTWEYGAP